MFAHFLGGERRVEHVARFDDVAGGAVVEADFNLVVIEAVHVLAHLNVGDEVVGFVGGDVVAVGEFGEFLLTVLVGEGFVAGLHLEDVAVDEVAAEEGEDGVGMVAPCLEGAPDVVVVEGKVVPEALGMGEEGVAVDVVGEEEEEGSGEVGGLRFEV